MGQNKKADIKYLFEHGGYSLHFRWCINTPRHYKDTGILPNSVAGEEGNRSGIWLMVTLKQLREYNGCDSRKTEHGSTTL